ncbi:MAG: hypothetical protein QNJ45_14690 [Ardenticatenaceae bacterium]|nr:hypothetical protein [Ardenticatenaceae bacterium]
MIKKIYFTSIFILIVGILALLPVTAYGHGGGRPQLFREPAGPYLVSVWSLPDPMTVGEVNLVVLVTGNQEGAVDNYILDADIDISLRRGLSTVETRATHDQATNNLFYESYFDIDRAGTWNVNVTVNGPAGEGTASFSMDVLDEGGTSINWLFYGGIGVGILVIVGLIWQFMTEEEEV